MLDRGKTGKALGGIVDERNGVITARRNEWNRHVAHDGVEVTRLEFALRPGILETFEDAIERILELSVDVTLNETARKIFVVDCGKEILECVDMRLHRLNEHEHLDREHAYEHQRNRQVLGLQQRESEKRDGDHHQHDLHNGQKPESPPELLLHRPNFSIRRYRAARVMPRASAARDTLPLFCSSAVVTRRRSLSSRLREPPSVIPPARSSSKSVAPS